jgi:hypothetical protein
MARYERDVIPSNDDSVSAVSVTGGDILGSESLVITRASTRPPEGKNN